LERLRDDQKLRIAAVLVFLATSATLWLLRPLVVSGDGVGYIKRLVSPNRDIVPGHLIYIPLLEWLRTVLVPEGGHGEAALIATAFSSIGGGLACACLFALTVRLGGKLWAGLLAAAGICVSYGFYRASGDVEAYSMAVAVITAIAALLLRRSDEPEAGWGTAIIAGLLLGLTTLLHTSLVLLTPFVLLACWRATGSWTKAIVAICIGGLLSMSSFLAVSMGVLGQDASGTVAWLMTADNGYAQSPSFSLSYLLRNLARLFYGMGRTLIHSPAPDRLGSEVSVHLSALGIGYLLAAVAVIVVGLVRTDKDRRHALWPLWLWAAPLVVFGFIFFPAATERWVMVLPCFWLVLSLALTTVSRRDLIVGASVALVAIPLVANILTIRQERELDRRTLERSRAISALLEPGDMLLYPGHTWDEYIGFYETAPVERFILASFAGEEQGDAEALLERLRRRVDATHERDGRVIAVRIFDAPDSHHGWLLLRALGIPRDDVLALLARYEVQPILDDPVAVWEISPSSHHGGRDQ
jgi:hypothetical protein